MKKSSVLILLLCLAAALSVIPLSRRPIRVFALRNSGSDLEAFSIETSILSRRSPEVRSVPLNASQRAEGKAVLERGDTEGLRTFAAGTGQWQAVIGMGPENDYWPYYLGGGWKALSRGGQPGTVDDLGRLDKVFLALFTQPPPPPPFSGQGLPAAAAQVPPGRKIAPAAPAPPPTPAPSRVLRVEIRNGCGITNAADWFARKFKGPGIVVTGTGNADRFNYPQTRVVSSAGVPVALEEALERAGLDKGAVTEAGAAKASVDVTVVIGKDFSRLKELVRERKRR